jgi:hypothetical protein
VSLEKARPPRERLHCGQALQEVEKLHEEGNLGKSRVLRDCLGFCTLTVGYLTLL